MRKVLIIGLGVSGRSAAQFLLQKGIEVTSVDKNRDLLIQDPQVSQLIHQGLQVLPETAPVDLSSYDLIVVSPGIPQSHPLYVAAKKSSVEVIGEVELAFRFIKKQRSIGITGTNGKTTVTLLVAHVLQEAGKPAKALGNVGVPLASELAESIDEDQILVIELSSFQLETIKSCVLDCGVVLNITPDHLDRYATMEEYAQAKMHLQYCLKPGGSLVLEKEAEENFGHLLVGEKARTYGFQKNSDFCINGAHLTYKGEVLFELPKGLKAHDLKNLAAAFILCQEMGVTSQQFLKAFGTFKKPPHRVQYVDLIDGVAYYDDSKGTNIDAVVQAVRSLSGNIILIAGGVDKGSSYTPWIPEFENKVSHIFVIGQAADKIKRDLSKHILVDKCDDLASAINCASQKAKKGDIVLLSPGCSSYDMFRDYKHRGEEFQRLVLNLKGIKR